MTDEEMYNKIELLQNDDETFGCFIKGHYDMEQFKRVAIDFLKTECEMETPEKYRKAQIGYYKVIPQGFYHFSKEKMRGSIPIMEMQYL